VARKLQDGGENIISFTPSGPTSGRPARPPSEPKATAALLKGSMRVSTVSEKSVVFNKNLLQNLGLVKVFRQSSKSC